MRNLQLVFLATLLHAAVGCHLVDDPRDVDTGDYGSARRAETGHTIRQAQFLQPSLDAEIPPEPSPLPIPLPGPRPREESRLDANDSTLAPRTIGEALNAESVEELAVPTTIKIDFSTALATAAGQNPRVAFADARIRAALARWDEARVLWLPSLRAGVTYNKHEGTLQNSNGAILDVSRSSLQSGLGVGAVGAGTPAVHGLFARFHGADAIFQPRITGCAAIAEEHAAMATANDLLLDSALAYLALLRASQDHAIAVETFQHAEQLADLSASFARTGEGPQADADRADTELAIRRNELARADEAVRVASVRLAELLRIDPSLRLAPQESVLAPIELIAADTELAELIATGLTNRPELSENQSLVHEAVHRLRREQYSSLIPSVILGVSTSGFGGGTGGTIDNFRDRFDLDAGVFWEMRSLGFGDRAARRQAAALVDQARARQLAVMDRVAREIAESQAQVASRQRQMATAQDAIKAATDSYSRNLTRIREGQGLPIEALQAIQALDQAQREYVRTVADYNESQFRLHRALGWPIQ